MVSAAFLPLRFEKIPPLWFCCAGVTLFIFAMVPWVHAAEPTSPSGDGFRPNILWITCEDISPNLGCYGDDFAVTPHLDRLAEQGTRYTNAFGITGVCAVNRSCLITGCYSSSLGSQDMRSRTRLPESIEAFTAHLRRSGYFCTNNSKTDYNFPIPKNAWDECSGKAHWRHRKEGQPFFAVFNETCTHESQYRLPDERFFQRTARLTEGQRHDPHKVPLPPIHPDSPESRQDWARYHDLITAMDDWVGELLEQLKDDGLDENTIVFFYSDHGAGMPGMKKWVWESGLRVPLIVHFPEQWRHLAPTPPGESTDRLVSFVDFAPTVLSLTGVTIPSYMQGKAFLGEKAAAPRESVHIIRDRMAERYDLIRGVRNKRYQYLRNFMPHLPWSQYVSYTEQMPTMRIWRSRAESGKLDEVQARYFQPKPTEELYDVAKDPWQLNNLADDPAHRETLRKMRRTMLEWQRETGDLGLLPEYEMHRRDEGITPWEVGHDPALNPLDALQPIALLASDRNPKNVRRLASTLGNQKNDPAVRWWAAMGLTMLGEKAAPATETLLTALDDPSPNVRVEAAEALSLLGKNEKAVPVLLEALEHPTPFIRLRAVNVFDRLDPSVATPHAESIRQASMQGIFPADYLNRITGYLADQLQQASEEPH